MLDGSKVYERVADQYDKLRKDMAQTSAISRLVDLTKVRSPRVLDAGCGPGRDVSVLLALGCRAFGADGSIKFSKTAAERNPKAEVVNCDLRSMPFETGFFHAVWSCGVISHFQSEQLEGLFLEFSRLLTKGGILSLCYPISENHELLVENFFGVRRELWLHSVSHVSEVISRSGMALIESSFFNEREMFGKNFRDMNFVISNYILG